MYNEEVKNAFILDYAGGILSTEKMANTLFNATEDFEKEWGADLATVDEETIKPMMDEVLGLRLRSHWGYRTILREYAKWCLLHKDVVPGATKSVLNVECDGVSKIRRQMVSGPVHLQNVLDMMFEPEDDKKIDNLYRCYFWMAFSGLNEEEALNLDKSCINLNEMQIEYDIMVVGADGEEEHMRKIAPIYTQARKAFENAVNLTSFVYENPAYTPSKRISYRDRVEGTKLMRGIRADTRFDTIRATISRITKKKSTESAQKALLSGDNFHEFQISYKRIQMSGIFYRAYERERAGMDVSFDDAIDLYHEKKYHNAVKRKYENGKRVSKGKRFRNLDYYFRADYERWKHAFD